LEEEYDMLHSRVFPTNGLKLIGFLAVVLVQAAWTIDDAWADAAPSTGKMSPLQQKALRLQAIIENKTLQPHGLIPMLVRPDGYQLPTAEDYRGAYRHRHLLGKTEAEIGIPPMHVWRAWEDSSANTAAYLGAMAYQYRCTQDPQALAICQRTLLAIKYIHDVAAEKGEPGFLCKPYGGVYSNQTSGDQVQAVVQGLVAYRPIAPPEDRALIDKLIRSFADHQIKVEYQCLHGYFAYPRNAWSWKDWNWNDGFIYATLLHSAWNSSGDPKYVREIRRWYQHCGLDKKVPPPTGKTIAGPVASRVFDLPALMMEFDPDHYELWRSFMVDSFQRGKIAVLPDGTGYLACEHNRETGVTTPRDLAGMGGGPIRSGRSAAFAKCCVTAQRWCPNEDMVGVARTIIEGLDEPTFRFIMPVGPDQKLSPQWQVEGRLLDHDGLTAWLWAYWEGRWRGYW
jgi:hypothetical protein